MLAPHTSAATILLCTLAHMAVADIINVPAEQPTIQAGIDAATSGDEIVVAPGTYNEIIDFSGKTIVVRSSDGAAVTIIDATGVTDPGTGLPVVRIDSGEGAGTTLEGFTITGGTGDTVRVTGSSTGGGVFIDGVDADIRECVFEGNTANVGGGLFVFTGRAITIHNCTFHANAATMGGGPEAGKGGGIYFNQGVAPFVVTDCQFDANTAEHSFPALYVGFAIGHVQVRGSTFENHVSSATGVGTVVAITGSSNTTQITVEQCLFQNNVNNGDGPGALLTSDPAVNRVTGSRFINNSSAGALPAAGALELAGSVGSCAANNVFIGNSSTSRGGAVYLSTDDASPLANCSFFGNSAPEGASVWMDLNHDYTIANCVFWGNTNSSPIFTTGAGTLTVTHCIVEDGWDGAGTSNLDADPLFVDAPNGDLRLQPDSPAIDSADADGYIQCFAGGMDASGEARLFDDPVLDDDGTGIATYLDRGAFEYQGSPCPADFNNDGVIDTRDVLAFLNAWAAGCP